MNTSLSLQQRLDESLAYIRTKTKVTPHVAIVLGSGLGDFAESLKNPVAIPTETIPHYPISTVEGHKGRLVFGAVGKVKILAFQGRVHYYETGNLNTILYPIHVAHAIGIDTLIVTNAAGGINKQYNPGDLMLMIDHINLTFENPVAGIESKSNFLHGETYDKKLQDLLADTAIQHHIPLQRGVYCGVKGPSYETASEIQMFRAYGADAVGMSTVNEASLASRLGMRVVGISCITNFAAGIKDLKLSHAEVTEVANMAKTKFTTLLRESIKRIG